MWGLDLVGLDERVGETILGAVEKLQLTPVYLIQTSQKCRIWKVGSARTKLIRLLCSMRIDDGRNGRNPGRGSRIAERTGKVRNKIRDIFILQVRCSGKNKRN